MQREVMLNRWHYAGLGQVSYGNEESYRRPVEWFDEVGGLFEDWGCGCAAAKQFVKKCRYLGLEGSHNDYADHCDVDLREYQSVADCILLRDVLDHNTEWRRILSNAIKSFRKRMVVVIFREPGLETKIVHVNTSPRYPEVYDLRFNKADLMELMEPYFVKEETINNETLFYLERK